MGSLTKQNPAVNGSGSLFILPMWPQLNPILLCGLIVAACVALLVLIYIWHRGGEKNPASDTVGESRGANQEHKESAGGNR